MTPEQVAQLLDELNEMNNRRGVDAYQRDLFNRAFVALKSTLNQVVESYDTMEAE